MKNTNRKKATAKQKAIPSPCINICELNEDNICVGCYRSGQEISRWGKMTPEEQLAVMEKVHQRESESGFVN